jgi:two-component system phosphate regulon response regulator PhoB
MSPAHILVVEDEEDIQQLVEYHLLKKGYTVTCASDGKEALSLVRSTPPD